MLRCAVGEGVLLYIHIVCFLLVFLQRVLKTALFQLFRCSYGVRLCDS